MPRISLTSQTKLTQATPRREATMFRRLLPSLLLLVSVSRSGQGRPHRAQEAQRLRLLEAVKTGILSSLGMDKEPALTLKASEEELRRMHQLYWEKLKAMRGNPSRTEGTTTSTVLVPATVAPIKAPQGGEQAQVQWYRAVFQKNPDFHTGARPTRAELKISRQTPAPPKAEIRVEVKQVNASTWTHTTIHASHALVTTDVSATVAKWIQADQDESLVVRVRTAEDGSDPVLSLEVDFIQARNGRPPRSLREDDCNDQGWCCRKSLNVSFKEIGWTDWVVAPAEYTMHLCDGACPHNYKPASMHTQVKSRLHQLMKGGTPRPCCVPASYEPMVLMHYDSKGRLELTPFNDLIVSACHCA
ncbi:growth/differentiation factor 15 [Nerophis ophidion]|uniref:growth/differentiation factor 15 n=1 Tax=Nerophis ophidion TaxID=159077 RepID=UPI002ADF9170|nr:growth/differentiation factor 15 [Nerophis ophidion]